MATIRQLLEEGNLGGQEKTAAAAATSADADGMDKLAMSLGLFDDMAGGTKTAEFPPPKKDDKKDDDDDDDDDKGEKKAAAGSLHSALFPNSVLGGAEKTAAEKTAEAEERLGAAAYDQFSSAVDRFVTKLAGEIIEGNPHGDSQPDNRLPNNKAGGKDKIDTAPKVTNMLPASNDAGTVGHYEQKTAAAAFRKQMILSQLEQ